MILRDSKGRLVRINILVLLLLHLTPLSSGINAHVTLNVEGEGFHRNFVYRVDLGNSDDSDDVIDENCYVAIHLGLPSSLYVNVDELADLRRLGVSTICSEGETDVELFMEKAKPQNVTACALFADTGIIFKLPIHQRYQYPKKHGGYVKVLFPHPKLLFGCKHRIKEYRVSKVDLCSPCVELVPKWREIPYTMEGEEDYIWLVPVGDSTLLTTITYVTLLFTILGAIYITATIYKSSSMEHEKRD